MLLLILSAIIVVKAVLTILGPDATQQNVIIALLVGGFAASRFFIPKRYEIYTDRLRIVFLLSRLDVMYATIDEVRKGRWWHVWGYWGLRFATVPRRVVEVRRKDPGLRRPNLVISPLEHETFIERIEEARAAFEGRLRPSPALQA